MISVLGKAEWGGTWGLAVAKHMLTLLKMSCYCGVTVILKALHATIMGGSNYSMHNCCLAFPSYFSSTKISCPHVILWVKANII